MSSKHHRNLTAVVHRLDITISAVTLRPPAKGIDPILKEKIYMKSVSL